MDKSTLEKIAEFICGDDPASAPEYRTGSELTRFFERAGFKAIHDGSTRKWWTLSVLTQLNKDQVITVIKRLASPREYGGDLDKVKQAHQSLNQILFVEGLKVEYSGANPVINNFEPDFNIDEAEEKLEPLPPPNFYALGIENTIAGILENRWQEADRCLKAEAYLAGIIIMGSLLEGLLLAVLQKKPKEANTSASAPIHKDTGKAKKFHEWTLNDMIEVAHEENWIDLDVKRFSHSLREFRNLVHPYEQMVFQVFPDGDTCSICWLVVQAAVNDLARILQNVK